MKRFFHAGTKPEIKKALALIIGMVEFCSISVWIS